MHVPFGQKRTMWLFDIYNDVQSYGWAYNLYLTHSIAMANDFCYRLDIILLGVNWFCYL